MKGLLNLNPKTMERLTDALVDSLRYSSDKLSYPDLELAKPDDGLPAEWFYKAINSPTGTSELTAILQYVDQETQFDEIGELALGIALVEMKHYGKLSELVINLGGRIENTFSAKAVKGGNNTIEALNNDLKSEEETVREYQALYDKIDKIEQKTQSIEVALQLIAKIVADEKVHITLLNNKLKDIKAFQNGDGNQ